MSHSFVMTVTGPESLGINKALAHTTVEAGGSWDRSKIVKQEGRFAAIITVSVEKSQEAELKAALEKEFSDLTFSYSELPAGGTTPLKVVSMELVCPNRPGLIRDINSRMLDSGLKVVHLDSRRYEVIELGGAVFAAKLDVEVPETTSAQSVVDELESLDEKMRVTVL